MLSIYNALALYCFLNESILFALQLYVSYHQQNVIIRVCLVSCLTFFMREAFNVILLYSILYRSSHSHPMETVYRRQQLRVAYQFFIGFDITIFILLFASYSFMYIILFVKIICSLKKYQECHAELLKRDFKIKYDLIASSATNECIICMDCISNKPFVRIKVCSHCFHYACIETWCSQISTCPICRKPIE